MSHYYPEDQSRDNCENIRWANVCAECGRQLALYLDVKSKLTYIACSGQVHEGITREYQPPVEDYESNIRREMELENKVGPQKAQTAVGIPKQGQLTEQQATHILSLVYPQIPNEEIVRVAIFCQDFGLHPLAKEVFIIGYKNTKTGKTDYSMVVGIPANRKIAHALKGAFSFLDDTPRAATKEEIEKQFGEGSDEIRDNLISITKLQGESGNRAVGFGLYPNGDTPKGMAKGNTRRNMCNIRSERQAMDRLPGKPMPLMDVVDAQYEVLPDIGKVDTATGEIIEAEVVEEPEPEVEAVPEPVIEEKQTGPSFIDLDWLRESLKTLTADGQTAYEEESMLRYLRRSFKGIEGDTVSEIAEKLDKGAAAHLHRIIKDALAKVK